MRPSFYRMGLSIRPSRTVTIGSNDIIRPKSIMDLVNENPNPFVGVIVRDNQAATSIGFPTQSEVDTWYSDMVNEPIEYASSWAKPGATVLTPRVPANMIEEYIGEKPISRTDTGVVTGPHSIEISSTNRAPKPPKQSDRTVLAGLGIAGALMIALIASGGKRNAIP